MNIRQETSRQIAVWVGKRIHDQIRTQSGIQCSKQVNSTVYWLAAELIEDDYYHELYLPVQINLK